MKLHAEMLIAASCGRVIRQPTAPHQAPRPETDIHDHLDGPGLAISTLTIRRVLMTGISLALLARWCPLVTAPRPGDTSGDISWKSRNGRASISLATGQRCAAH